MSNESDLASEFLDTWLPFLSKDLCQRCTKTLSDRLNSLSSAFDSRDPRTFKRIMLV